MELCDLNLDEYIYHERPIFSYVGANRTERAPEELPFIQGHEDALAQMVNVWTIMIHIASGVDYLHSHGRVHRDLKPKNSISHATFFILTISVLYSHSHAVWKLTDFGISTEATSKQARATTSARGTAGYRAPELLTDKPIYTNKSDIWGLGCILYELCTRKKAFENDWKVQEYAKHPRLPFPSALPDQHQPNIYECIQRLLTLDWQQRPRAAILVEEFIACRETCQSSDESIIPHRLGLEILGRPRCAASFPPFVDVIFVHGLGGTARGTWTHQESRGFWPIWLSQCRGLEHMRLLTFGYDSGLGKIWRSDGTLNIDNIASQLLSALTSHYLQNSEVFQHTFSPDADFKAPSVFVAHGMGGLIVKKVLNSYEQVLTSEDAIKG